MTEVYIVTSGDYSDYQIQAVFDNEETAKLFAKLSPENQVEVYELNPEVPFESKLRNGYHPFHVQIDIDGNGYAHQTLYNLLYIKAFMYYGKLIVYTWAKDSEHALKIANEKRAKIIADGLWSEDYSEF